MVLGEFNIRDQSTAGPFERNPGMCYSSNIPFLTAPDGVAIGFFFVTHRTLHLTINAQKKALNFSS
jgi:hypothetical protein